MDALVDLSAQEIAARVARREVSAVEVVAAQLDRITTVDERLGAFLHVAAEGALHDARAIDARVAARESLPLAGVPLAVKDNLHIEGLPTTCASRILAGYRPPYTATAVARLIAAGAIVIGKTNLDEFAMGSSTEMSAFKTTRNPWDATRVPGGSSGGSAVAVAARLAPLALGSDTGGSIRQPAAFCGVMGLKPTYGRVSRYGLVAFASSLDQIGPLARTTADLALTLALLSGADEHDATSAAQPVPDYLRLLREQPLPRRIGVPWRELEQGVDAEVLASFREALRALESSGVTLVPIALPHLAHAVATYYIVATAEASSNLERYDGVRYGLRAGTPADLAELYGCTRDAGFGPEVKRRIILGTFVLSTGYYDAYYLRAQKARALIRQDFEQALATCDAIAMPTTPTPPFRIGEKTDDPLKMYLEDIFTVPANLAGLPGLSLPIRPARQLPCGLQLLGRAWDEIALLRLGGALEEQGLCTCSAPTL